MTGEGSTEVAMQQPGMEDPTYLLLPFSLSSDGGGHSAPDDVKTACPGHPPGQGQKWE